MNDTPNDTRCTLIPGRFIALTDDNTKKVFMRVSFDVDGNDVVCMTTSQEQTYMSAGKEKSLSAGDKLVFPLDHVIVLCTTASYAPRISVRVVKMTAPRDPTPPPQAVAPPPLPAQERKKSKKRRREFEFYMY